MKNPFKQWLNKIIDKRVGDILDNANEMQFHDTDFLKSVREHMIEGGTKETFYQLKNMDRLFNFRKWRHYHKGTRP